ncbi:MAG: M20 family metallopeptidase [Bacteroidota bacterium]|nr:M20 family metallopeptidase [Bacteroidota bacterium]
MDSIAETISQSAREIFDETVSLRRHFHMYPELSFNEYDTSQFICDYLDKHKIDYIRNLAGTGIIAWIKGAKENGKVIALRTELDALPVKEATGLEYASKKSGIMHACGHDAHMAMLISSIIIIKGIRKHFGGKIAFIFQPGEELAPGGARLIMDTGAFKDLNPDLVIAQHVLPEFESGMTGFRAGKYMASSDEIHIRIYGRGGHAALADQYTDQVLIGSELVVRLKEAAANYNTKEPLVLGIGHFTAQGAANVVPEEVNIKGTIRTFDEKIRKDIKELVSLICKQTEEKYRVNIELKIPDGYPVLVNNDEYINMSVNLAKEINGENMVKEIGPRMSSEDFAFYAQKYPVVFYRLGISSKSEGKNGLHTPVFTLDEKTMITGVRTLSYLGVKFTGSREQGTFE